MGGSRVNYFGSRSPLGHCFQFLHSGPNSAYASFGYRPSGSPLVADGRPGRVVWYAGRVRMSATARRGRLTYSKGR